MVEEQRIPNVRAFENALYQEGEGMAEVEIHPIANLFPPMTGEDYS